MIAEKGTGGEKARRPMRLVGGFVFFGVFFCWFWGGLCWGGGVGGVGCFCFFWLFFFGWFGCVCFFLCRLVLFFGGLFVFFFFLKPPPLHPRPRKKGEKKWDPGPAETRNDKRLWKKAEILPNQKKGEHSLTAKGDKPNEPIVRVE